MMVLFFPPNMIKVHLQLSHLYKLIMVHVAKKNVFQISSLWYWRKKLQLDGDSSRNLQIRPIKFHRFFNINYSIFPPSFVPTSSYYLALPAVSVSSILITHLTNRYYFKVLSLLGYYRHFLSRQHFSIV